MANARAVKMIERREPHHFLFCDVGDVLEGLLVKRKRIRSGVRSWIQYTVDDNGQLYRFIGAHQIEEKIQPGDVGKRVRISYQGVGTSVTFGRTVRAFRVFVSGAAINQGPKRGGTRREN